jgi:hypothetical protein
MNCFTIYAHESLWCKMQAVHEEVFCEAVRNAYIQTTTSPSIEDPVRRILPPPTRFNPNNERQHITVIPPHHITAQDQPLNTMPLPLRFSRNKRCKTADSNQSSQITIPRMPEAENDPQQMQFVMEEMDMLIGQWSG